MESRLEEQGRGDPRKTRVRLGCSLREGGREGWREELALRWEDEVFGQMPNNLKETSPTYD